MTYGNVSHFKKRAHEPENAAMRWRRNIVRYKTTLILTQVYP